MSNAVHLGRQPIFDKSHQIIGYELLFRRSPDATEACIRDESAATAQVLECAFVSLGAEAAIGDKLAFVNVTPAILSGNALAAVPPERVVLEVPGSVMMQPDLLAKCRNLRAAGFRFAIDRFYSGSPASSLMGVADFVKLDASALGADGMRREAAALRGYSGKLVAERVESQPVFATLSGMGMHYFQGYSFAKPEILTGKVVSPAQMNIIELMQKIRNGADANDIATNFKRDVGLSLKILKYINSVGFALSCEVHSIKHAINIIGYKQLYRWASLLLAAGDSGRVPPALVKTAVTRGRFMELVAEGTLDRNDLDNLFVTGVFSLLDVILGMEMEHVVEQVPLPESVKDALAYRKGVYAPYLVLAEACEKAGGAIDFDHLLLTPEKVFGAQLSALRWVEAVGVA